jgi:UDP-glucuronate 4-epimerase
MTRRVVVTGCAGFIGSHLVRRLLDDPECRVLGIDCFDPFYSREAKLANLLGLPADRFTLATIDITDRSATHSAIRAFEPHAIYHIAALAGVRPSIAAPERYVSVNLDGLVNVLDGARAATCERVVFASSSSVYGNADRVPFREDDAADKPISPYAATKRAGELICHAYASLFSMRIACLRFFTVYGPAQRPDLAIMLFMRRIALGEPIEMFGDGSTSRDYTYVDDIVDGVVRAGGLIDGTPAPFCRIFNLGGSHPISLAEMIAKIETTVGRKAVVVRRPAQPGDVDRTCADVTRCEAELGFRAKVDFTEGLRRQWAWLSPRLDRHARSG